MTGWNLPPGVTDQMIDEAACALDEPDDPPTLEEQEGEAWEYWHARAMTAELHIHMIRQLEPGTQEWIDKGALEDGHANHLLAEIFRIARAAAS